MYNDNKLYITRYDKRKGVSVCVYVGRDVLISCLGVSINGVL